MTLSRSGSRTSSSRPSAISILLQSDEALQKARERLEFTREMMLIPKNLAGEYMLHKAHTHQDSHVTVL